ncbi:CAP domain-containing protein, partial [Eggerthella lenta]
MARRILACLLAIALSCSFMPLTAWADESSVETVEATVGELDEGSAPEASSSIAADLSDSCIEDPSADENGSLEVLSVDEGPMKQVESGVQSSDYDIVSVDGVTTKFNGSYAGTVRVMVFGRSTCFNTATTSERLRSLLSEDSYSNVRGFVLCADSGDVSAFSRKYKGADDKNMTYAADGYSYNSLMWKLCRQVGFGGFSLALPFVAIVDQDNAIRYASTGLLSEGTLRAYLDVVLGTRTVEDALGTVDFKIPGKDNARSARSVLAMVNEERSKKGVSALSWDEDLEKAAQQRAAEIAISFSHDRPNGASCLTAIPPAKRNYAGENIFIGLGSSAKTAHDAWTDSPGHYANMVNSGYASLGVASFVCSAPNGRSCTGWVEMFSSAKGTGMVAQVEDDVAVVRSISAMKMNLDLKLSGSGALDENETEKFVLYNVNKEWSYATQAIDPSSATWHSSDASVVSVDRTGLVSAKKAGSATVTASVGGVSASIGVKVSAA